MKDNRLDAQFCHCTLTKARPIQVITILKFLLVNILGKMAYDYIFNAKTEKSRFLFGFSADPVVFSFTKKERPEFQTLRI